MKTSAQHGDILITYALGSCLGIAIYDPIACVGGLLHAMLPTSANDPANAPLNPYKFVDTGLTELLFSCYEHGARKERLVVKVAGGSSSAENATDDYFQIGRRNFSKLKELLWGSGMRLQAWHVGGNFPRTLSLEIGSWDVTVKADISRFSL